ncbi:MAG: substrate-binding domain-containing protein [Cyanobacteria bacterium P01_D01_bin.156]
MLKHRSVFSLAATVALLAAVAPSQQPFFQSAVLAATTFEVPADVPSGTTVSVSSGADAMTVISEALKAGFEDKFNGTNVNVDTVPSDQAIEAVLHGSSELAAISRPLSDAEVSQGLVAENIQRVKIAVIVGAENPFNGNLTTEQFAKIFRGEITNWSEVGGPNTPIRLVDRPITSDTRISLSPYPVFKAAQFATGSTATQVNADSTADIVQQLGQDGISYALFDEVDGMTGINILPMHKTLPTDSRYPFSQPFSLVYQGEPSVGSAAFLGYAAGKPGQTTLQGVNPFSGLVKAASNTVTGAADAAGNVANATGDAVQGAAGAAGNAIKGAADTAGNVAGAAGVAAGGVAGATGDVIKGAADTAGDVAGAAGNAIQGAAGAAGDAVTNAADAADNTVQGAADATTNAVEATANTRNPNSQTRLNLWWLMVVPAACLGLVAWGERRRREHEEHTNQRYATGTSHTTGANYATAPSAKGPKLKAPNVVDGIGRAGAAAGGAATAAGGAAWATTRQTGNVAKEGLNNLGNTAKGGVGAVKGGLDNIGDAAQGGVTHAGQTAKDGLGNLKNSFDRAGNAVQGGVSDMGTGIKDGLNNAGDTARGGLDTVKGGLNNAGNAVQGGVSAMGNGIKGGLNQAGNTLGNGADAVTDGVSNVADKTGNAMKSSVNDAKNAPKSLWDSVRKGVNNAAEKADDLANHTKNQANNVKDGVENLGQQGIDKASDIADKFTNSDH